MVLKMLFGTVVSAVLSYAVLSLSGFYDGMAPSLDFAGSLVLTAVYASVFRAGTTPKASEREVPVDEPVAWKENRNKVSAAELAAA